jgi:hypothetical protein
LEPAYVGIDVACAKRKALPISVCVNRNGRLTPLPLRTVALRLPRGGGNVLALETAWRDDFAAQTESYLREVEEAFSVRIERIALDAPSAPCRADIPRRCAEQALDNRRISCFTTPSGEQFKAIEGKARAHLEAGGQESRLPHANQLWMLVGFALFERLGRTWPCLEVYPQATVALLGVGALHKSSGTGLSAQTRAVGQRLGWDEAEFERALKLSGFGAPHDQFDAYLAAWVASLDEGDREPLGIPPADAIWVPRLGL